MSSPVTWYRITNVAVALGFAVAKYTMHGGKISTVDFAGGVSTGVVLYVLGWWEKTPRLQWFFEPDWQAQLAKLKGLIPKVVSKYAREIICVLLLIFQIPVILMLAGIRLYRGESNILHTFIYAGIGVLFVFPSVWTLFYGRRKGRSLTRFESIFLGITAVLWLCISVRYAILFFINHEGPSRDNVPFAICALLIFLASGSFAAGAMRGRVIWA